MDDAVTNITDRNQVIGDTIFEGMMLRLGCTFTAISFCRMPSARYLGSVPVLGCVRLLYFDSKLLWRDVLFPLNRSMNIDFCGRMFVSHIGSIQYTAFHHPLYPVHCELRERVTIDTYDTQNAEWQSD